MGGGRGGRKREREARIEVKKETAEKVSSKRQEKKQNRKRMTQRVFKCKLGTQRKKEGALVVEISTLVVPPVQNSPSHYYP